MGNRRSTGVSHGSPDLPEGTSKGERSDLRWLEGSPNHVKELSDRVTELSTLMGVSTLLSSEDPLSEVLEAVCRLSTEICKAQVCFIHLVDGEDDPVCIGRHTPADSLQYAWEGIARIYGRKAIQKEEMVACSNLLLRQEGAHQDHGDPRMGGICAVPLKGRARTVGALSIGYPNTHRFSAREKDVLHAISAQVAMAVERSWLFDQLQGQLLRANSLREVATSIASNLELDTVLDSILTYASRLLAAEFSAIFLLDQPSVGADHVEGRGRERGQVHGRRVPLEDGPLGNAVLRAMETARPAIAQSLLQRPPSSPLSEEVKPNDYRAALAVPLLVGREVLGALVTCYLERRRFDASDISLAEDFAGQAALAIRNARLYGDAMEHRLSLEAAINQINNHGICLLDDQLNIRFANSATFWLLGASPKMGQVSLQEWTGLLRKALVEGGQVDQLVAQLRDNPKQTVVAELSARGVSDSPRALKLLSLPLRQMDGTISGRVNLIEED